jgi:hypothetical protein
VLHSRSVVVVEETHTMLVGLITQPLSAETGHLSG